MNKPIIVHNNILVRWRCWESSFQLSSLKGNKSTVSNILNELGILFRVYFKRSLRYDSDRPVCTTFLARS